MKFILFAFVLFFSCTVFGQSYDPIYGKKNFKDSLKTRYKNNAALDSVLTTDTLGRVFLKKITGVVNYDSLKRLFVDTSVRRNGYLLAFDSVNHKWYLTAGTASSGGTVTSIATAYGINGGTITTTGTLIADTASAGGLVSKSNLSNNLALKLNATDTQYLRRDINLNTSAITTKQSTLVSGTNIKTINGSTILGSGNIVISGSGGGVDSGAYRSYQQINDTSFALIKANGIKDTFRFSIGSTSGSGLTYAGAFPIVISGSTISLDTTNIANKTEIFFRKGVNPSNTLTGGTLIATKTQLDSLAIGVRASSGQTVTQVLTVGAGAKFYEDVFARSFITGQTAVYSNRVDFGNNLINISANNVNSGIQIGIGAAASGTYGGISIGQGANTNDYTAIALGHGANSSGSQGIAIGPNAKVDNVGDGIQIAIGQYSYAKNKNVSVFNGANSENDGDLVFGNGAGNTISEMYGGSGVIRGRLTAHFVGSGADFRLNGSGGFGTDTSGGVLRLAGGKGTGMGKPGNVVIQTPIITTTGTTLQTLTDRLTVTPTGVYITNSTTEPPTPASGGVFWIVAGALKYKSAGGTITTIANN